MHSYTYIVAINSKTHPVPFHWLLVACIERLHNNNFGYHYSYFFLFALSKYDTNDDMVFSSIENTYRNDVALFEMIPNVALFVKRIVRKMDDMPIRNVSIAEMLSIGNNIAKMRIFDANKRAIARIDRMNYLRNGTFSFQNPPLDTGYSYQLPIITDEPESKIG